MKALKIAVTAAAAKRKALASFVRVTHKALERAGKTKPAAFHPGGRTYGRFFNAALTGRNYRTAGASNQPLA
ncbi:hypothetical protein [Cupriavidus nantongensis]